MIDRDPLPPAIRVSALQDRVHMEPVRSRCCMQHPKRWLICDLPRGHEGAHRATIAEGAVWWPQARTPHVVTVTPPRYDDVFWEGV